MTLSGGALGVSFTFLKNFVGTASIKHPWWLFAAWIFWGASATGTLFSLYTSTLALRRAIKQTDEKSVYVELALGHLATFTKILNFSGGALFFAGVIRIGVFVAS